MSTPKYAPAKLPPLNLPAAKGSSSRADPAASTTRGVPPSIPPSSPADHAVLGICYGQQLMAHLLGGTVREGRQRRVRPGHARTGSGFRRSAVPRSPGPQQIWMSHRDLVDRPCPPASPFWDATGTCAVAAMAEPDAPAVWSTVPSGSRPHHARQRNSRPTSCFRHLRMRARLGSHASHSARLSRRYPPTWSGDRNVFFFVSGGVDSTVAYTLCLRALGRRAGARRLCGYRPDAGGRNRIRAVACSTAWARRTVEIDRAEDQFLAALGGVRDPEQ